MDGLERGGESDSREREDDADPADRPLQSELTVSTESPEVVRVGDDAIRDAAPVDSFHCTCDAN